MALTQPRLVAAFYGMALTAGWAPFVIRHFTGGLGSASLGYWAATATWIHFPPLLAALVLTGAVLKQPVRPNLGITFEINRFWGPAWLSPILVLLIAIAIAWAMSGVEPIHTTEQYVAWKRTMLPPEDFARMVQENPPGHPFWLLVRGLPSSVTFQLIAALAFESGFRGFLFREMPGGYWGRSLRIGLLAGIYIAPLAWLYFPESISMGVLLIIAYSVVLSPVLVYIRVRAGSVVPVALYVSMVTTLTRPALEICSAIPATIRPFYGVSGILTTSLLLGACYLHDRFMATRRLMPERAPATAPSDHASDSAESP